MAAALTLLILAVSVLSNASPTSAAPALDSEEQEFLQLLNEYRAQNGKAALLLQEDLNEAADWYTADMATQNYYGGDAYCGALKPPKQAHCDSQGRMPLERVRAFGYPQGIVGENLAAGFITAQSVFDAWKASPGHNKAMVASYKAIGIGRNCNSDSHYRCYWVTDFGTYTGPGATNAPSATTPAPTQAPTPTPTAPPTPTATPEPTFATHVWDDINCDGSVTAEDAIYLMRDDLGFGAAGSDGCPAVSDLVMVDGAWRVWGDTDCTYGVQVLDSITLLAFLAGVPFGDVDDDCPAPGTIF